MKNVKQNTVILIGSEEGAEVTQHKAKTIFTVIV